MFRCLRVRSQLGAYLDGELSPRRRTAIDRHLGRCRSCQTTLDGLRSLGQTLQTVEAPPVPSNLAFRIMTEARNRQTVEREPRFVYLDRGLSASRTWAFRVAAAAVLILGLATGSYMGRSVGRSRTQPMTAQVAGQADPLDTYNLDYLGNAPKASLAGSYLAMASGRNGEGY